MESGRAPRGCRTCEGSGYRGRVALYERLSMDSHLRDLTFRGVSLEDIRNAGVSSGALRALIIDGARKVVDGTTTVNEVLRVCRSKD